MEPAPYEGLCEWGELIFLREAHLQPLADRFLGAQSIPYTLCRHAAAGGRVSQSRVYTLHPVPYAHLRPLTDGFLGAGGGGLGGGRLGWAQHAAQPGQLRLEAHGQHLVRLVQHHERHKACGAASEQASDPAC